MRTDEDRERLLWQLTETESPVVEPAPAGAPPETETLAAYVRGTLDAADRAAVERWLTHSADVRARLLALADLEDDAPEGAPDDVRRKLVTRFGVPRFGGRRRLRWGLAAAAVLALAVAGSLILPAPPAPAAYQVSIAGLRTYRAPGAASAVARAQPETMVTVAAEARDDADAGTRVGFYRPEGGRLVRLEPSPQLVIDADPGVAVLRATAHRLVGRRPGRYALYVVLATDAGLPAELALPPADAAELTAHGRRIARLVLHLEPAAAPNLDDGRPTPEEDDDGPTEANPTDPDAHRPHPDQRRGAAEPAGPVAASAGFL